MNLVLVLIDSLNRHDLRTYAETPIETPNLTRLARRCWVFENHFVGSLPCMPARREIFAGVKEMMWRPWGPLEPFDARLPRLLEAAGYRTALVTDHYHYWEEPSNGYLQTFQSVECIRGHELDTWRPPVPPDEPVPPWVENIERWRPGKGRRYYANVRDFEGEDDFFPARVMTGARRWLERHAREHPFYLQIESFDVHEPFHVPEPYASMYGDGAGQDRFTVWPPYQDTEQMARFMAQATREELDFIRSRYAAKLSMVDRWLGDVLETMDRLALWDDTALILTTDHGHDLAERGSFGKQYPHYDSHANIPLFVWHPRLPGKGRRISALTSTVDLFAAVLDLLGAPLPDGVHSRSLAPLMTGRSEGVREAVVYGTFGQGVCCTDGTWTLFKSPEGEAPLYFYSAQVYQSQDTDRVWLPVDSGRFLPGVDCLQWKMPIRLAPLSRESFLFHRSDDPSQSENLWEQEPAQRKRMLDLVRELLEQEGTPPEQYERLGLRP